jgi:hypothetical protein
MSNAPNNPPLHLVIGTPCYGGQVTTIFTRSLLKLQNACFQKRIILSTKLLWGDALITRARQNIVGHFLEDATATHLLFVDADIGFEPDQVFRLMEFNEPVTAAIYPTKRIDWDRLRVLASAGYKDLESISLAYVIEFEDPKNVIRKNGFAQVKYVGTGFLMIQRNALIQMIQKYPELHYTREHRALDELQASPWRSAIFNCMIDEHGFYLSEDYSFCRRWTDMGGKIWADLHSRLVHFGSMSFKGDLATQISDNSNLPVS